MPTRVSSGPVQWWSPTPCQLLAGRDYKYYVAGEILIVFARVCMTVLFQCKLWLCRLFSFYTVQIPAHHRVPLLDHGIANAGSASSGFAGSFHFTLYRRKKGCGHRPRTVLNTSES